MASPALGRLFGQFVGNSARQAGTNFLQGFVGSAVEDGMNSGREKLNEKLKESGSSVQVPKTSSPPPSSIPEMGGAVMYGYLKQNSTYIKAKVTQSSLGQDQTSQGLNTFVHSTENPFSGI